MGKSRAAIPATAPVLSIMVAAAIAAASMAVDAATSETAATSNQATHVVEIQKFQFGRQNLAVRRGDVIVWVNKDIVPHTATARDGSWDTGQIDPGGQARTVVTDDFFRRYLCSYHVSMTGRLDAADRSDPKPNASRAGNGGRQFQNPEEDKK
jgi:plastocyanin